MLLSPKGNAKMWIFGYFCYRNISTNWPLTIGQNHYLAFSKTNNRTLLFYFTKNVWHFSFIPLSYISLGQFLRFLGTTRLRKRSGPQPYYFCFFGQSLFPDHSLIPFRLDLLSDYDISLFRCRLDFLWPLSAVSIQSSFCHNQTPILPLINSTISRSMVPLAHSFPWMSLTSILAIDLINICILKKTKRVGTKNWKYLKCFFVWMGK